MSVEFEPITTQLDGHPALINMIAGEYMMIACSCGAGATRRQLADCIRDIRKQHRGRR